MSNIFIKFVLTKFVLRVLRLEIRVKDEEYIYKICFNFFFDKLIKIIWKSFALFTFSPRLQIIYNGHYCK